MGPGTTGLRIGLPRFDPDSGLQIAICHQKPSQERNKLNQYQ